MKGNQITGEPAVGVLVSPQGGCVSFQSPAAASAVQTKADVNQEKVHMHEVEARIMLCHRNVLQSFGAGMNLK